jgi:hypothetical protein
MRGKLVTAACGLMLAAALGIPAAAQAAVARQGPADTTTTTAAHPRLDCSSNGIFDVGNHLYAGHDGNLGYIAFNASLSNAIPYCYVPDPTGGVGNFFIEEEVNGALSGMCLTGMPNGTEWFMDEIPCASRYTDWVGNTVGSYHGHTAWLLQDTASNLCMYDDTQHPAIENSCADHSDGFMWFVFDALP